MTAQDLYCIKNGLVIILHEGTDIVAVQEVFNGKESLAPIPQYLGTNWDYAREPSTIAKQNYRELIQKQPDYDQFGEGMAFIWDVRNPLYGRFSPAWGSNGQDIAIGGKYFNKYLNMDELLILVNELSRYEEKRENNQISFDESAKV